MKFTNCFLIEKLKVQDLVAFGRNLLIGKETVKFIGFKKLNGGIK